MSTSYPTGENSASSNQPFLSAAHQKHIEGRGLLNDWSRSNCRTITAEEASLYLGYLAKSGGILFVGKNGQIQFRPDKAWRASKSEKTAPKYRSPFGEFDAYLPIAPDNPLYWEIEALKREAFYINDHPYIVLTEGVFKAIAGCSNNLPTISLLGVEQGLTGKKGDVEGKRYLVSALRTLAEAGSGFIIAFDADAINNPNISIAAKPLPSNWQSLMFLCGTSLETGNQAKMVNLKGWMILFSTRDLRNSAPSSSELSCLERRTPQRRLLLPQNYRNKTQVCRARATVYRLGAKLRELSTN